MYEHNTWYFFQSLFQTICTNEDSDYAIILKKCLLDHAWLFLGLFVNLFQQCAPLRWTAGENQHPHSHFCLAKHFVVFPKHFTWWEWLKTCLKLDSFHKVVPEKHMFYIDLFSCLFSKFSLDWQDMYNLVTVFHHVLAKDLGRVVRKC